MALLEEKLLNGTEGVVTLDVGDKVLEVAEVTKLEATAEAVVTEYKVMGNRATQSKANGWKGEGTMTIRYGSRYFRDILLEYIKTGKMKYVTVTVMNDDPNFEAGPIKTRLGGIFVKKVTVAQLDVEKEILDEEIPFSFTEVEDL